MYQQAIAINRYEINGSFYEPYIFNVKLIIYIISIFSILYAFASLFIENLPSLLFLVLVLQIYILQAFRGILNITGFGFIINISLMLESFLKPFSVFFLLGEVASLESYVLSLNIAYFCTIFQIYIYLKTKKLLKKDSYVKIYTFKHLLNECYHNGINGLLSLIQNQGYRIVLGYSNNYQILGLYSLVAGVGQTIFGALASIYYQSQIPRLYKNIDLYFKSYIYKAAILIFIFSIIVILFQKQILNVLLSNKYEQLSYLIAVGFVIESLQLFMGAIIIYCNIKKLKSISIIIYLITSVTTLVLCCFQYFLSVSNINFIPFILFLPQLIALTFFYLWYMKYINKN